MWSTAKGLNWWRFTAGGSTEGAVQGFNIMQTEGVLQGSKIKFKLW